MAEEVVEGRDCRYHIEEDKPQDDEKGGGGEGGTVVVVFFFGENRLPRFCCFFRTHRIRRTGHTVGRTWMGIVGPCGGGGGGGVGCLTPHTTG